MIEAYRARLSKLLEAFDALAKNCGDTDALDELNAEFEDALLLLSEIRESSDGWEEELDDALEEFAALAGDYRALAKDIPALAPLAEQLAEAAQAMRQG